MSACRFLRPLVIAAWGSAAFAGQVAAVSSASSGLVRHSLPAFVTQDRSDVGPIRLRVAYAPALRNRVLWRRELRCAVVRASGLLEPTLGRRLEVIDRMLWLGGGKNHSAEHLRSDLVRNVPPGDADLVVGLASVGRTTLSLEARDAILAPVNLGTDRGLSAYTRGYVVLSVGGRELCGAYRLLAHEIGHVFGGVHRSGDWLMDPGARGLGVDPLNAVLLSLHRDRRFGPGLAPLEGADLRTLWRLSRADPESARTWVVLGGLAVKMEKPLEAAGLYERALGIDPGHIEAQINLGHARFMLGDYAGAEAGYVRALEMKPDDGLLHNNLAAIYYGRGELFRAAAHLRAAVGLGLDVDPRFVVTLERLTGEKIR